MSPFDVATAAGGRNGTVGHGLFPVRDEGVHPQPDVASMVSPSTAKTYFVRHALRIVFLLCRPSFSTHVRQLTFNVERLRAIFKVCVLAPISSLNSTNIFAHWQLAPTLYQVCSSREGRCIVAQKHGSADSAGLSEHRLRQSLPIPERGALLYENGQCQQ